MSQISIHNTAIDMLTDILNSQTINITIYRKCSKIGCANHDIFIIDKNSDFVAQKEYTFLDCNNNKCRADITYKHKSTDEIKYIFEIKKSHYTNENKRLGYNWFEINATDITKKISTNFGVKFECIRWRPCSLCINKNIFDINDEISENIENSDNNTGTYHIKTDNPGVIYWS
jgi:hypothetical protein